MEKRRARLLQQHDGARIRRLPHLPGDTRTDVPGFTAPALAPGLKPRSPKLARQARHCADQGKTVCPVGSPAIAAARSTIRSQLVLLAALDRAK
jgi:hypothetical protein